MLLILSLLPGPAIGLVNVNSVYFEMPPFIYHENGVLKGMFPDIAQAARELCDLNITFTVNTENATNFHALLHNNQTNKKYIDEHWLWFPVVEYLSKQTLDGLKLHSLILFTSPGMEVVVHRDQIGLLPKIINGVVNSRYLIIMALILSVIFGILIWFIVRYLHFSRPILPKCSPRF